MNCPITSKAMEEKQLMKRRKKALKDKNDNALINACSDLAYLYMNEGQFDSAIEEYATIADTYKKNTKVFQIERVNRRTGEASIVQRNFVKALECQNKYLDHAKEVNDKLEEHRALATIGYTHLFSYLDCSEPDKKNLELANKFFNKSLIASQSLRKRVDKTKQAVMKTRLYSNLSMVQDHMGNWAEASDLIIKSINLCESYGLDEQLQKGHITMASLYMKKGEFQRAVQQYDLAIKTAKKLRSKPNLLAGILLSKSEAFLKLEDLHRTRNALQKAYKLKLPDAQDRELIEKNLKAIACMCKATDQLETTASTDYATRKDLYDKMGDSASNLKQFDKAVDYYKKMLDSAQKAGMSDSQLATCYYSIAETYKDNGQYEEAVVYYEQELDLCSTLKDTLITLRKIAKVKETANCDLTEVQDVYEGAIDLCRNAGDSHEEGRATKRLIRYLRRQNQHSQASQFEEELKKLDYQSSDTDGEASEGHNDDDNVEFDIKALTDESDDSDIEQPSTPRRRTKTFQVRKNPKGETQLHRACMKEQLKDVRRLLVQGHPVNVRDNNGWLPLHEACIRGDLELVKLLVEKGAIVSDRGGSDNLDKGITPIHDAASHGHLSVVQFLLDTGVKPVTKTNNGLTVLDCLNEWRSKAQLDEDANRLYKSLNEKLTQAGLKCNRICDDLQTTQTSILPTTKDNQRNMTSEHKGVTVGKRPAEGAIDIGKSAKSRKTVKSQSSRKSIDSSQSKTRRSTSSGSRSDSTRRRSKKKPIKLKIEADSTASSRTNSRERSPNKIPPTLSIDVRISSKLYRIPILLSEVQSLDIKWLAEKAALRHARKEYMVPILELETKSGAILAHDDPISLLFPMGTTQAEQVEGRIVKWNVPPIAERYKKACQDMSLAPHDDLYQSLHELSVSLDLCNRGCKSTTLAPLCKVLNRQTNLIELDLSGNFLNKECFQFLGISLASLENLHKLNLNCMGLQTEDLRILINDLPPDTVYKLNELNLSDNHLGDESFVHLATLTRRFHLKVLNLSGNKFTKNAYNHCLIHQLNLGEIEEFDVSDNYLENAALIRVLSWLNFGKLVSLNLSRNSVSEGFMQQVINLWTDARRLKVCKLSRCHVQDSDLFDLLRLSNSLEDLDVSYNNDLTSVSLRRLFQSEINNIDAYSCQSIFRRFSEFSKYVDHSSRGTGQSRTIKLTLPEDCHQEVRHLIRTWRNLYGNHSSVERTARFIRLSC